MLLVLFLMVLVLMLRVFLSRVIFLVSFLPISRKVLIEWLHVKDVVTSVSEQVKGKEYLKLF